MCKRGVEGKCRRLSTTSARVAVGTELQARDQFLEKVDTFKYLGSILSFDDS